MIPIDHKVMTFWFHGDGFANSGNHVFAIAVGLAEVVGILLPKAHVQNTRACQRTLLQLSQKLWLIGVIKPSRPPVSAMS